MPKAKEVEQRKCADCGLEYDAGAPHGMFCAARTCDGCGTTFASASALHATGATIDRDGVEADEKWCDDCFDQDRIEDEDEDD